MHQAIQKAGITKEMLSAVAFTRGPGLMGSLLVGTSFAKSLAYGLDIPLIEVNHMQAHILAHFIEEDGFRKPPFPFLAMTISGGHTQIVKVSNYFEMKVLGETLDDAVGEAFDKSALLLNRTTAAVRNRYYNYLRRARMTRKSKEKCIVIDKDTVSEYRKEYRQQDDVTIIILHIRGKR